VRVCVCVCVQHTHPPPASVTPRWWCWSVAPGVAWACCLWLWLGRACAPSTGLPATVLCSGWQFAWPEVHGVVHA